MRRFNPSRRSLILPLGIELLDEIVFHRRPDIGESPSDALVMPDDHKRNARRDSRYIEVAPPTSHCGFHTSRRAFCFRASRVRGSCVQASSLQMRLVPKVRHLVVQVHIIRQQRFPRNRMPPRHHPVIRSRPEGVIGESGPGNTIWRVSSPRALSRSVLSPGGATNLSPALQRWENGKKRFKSRRDDRVLARTLRNIPRIRRRRHPPRSTLRLNLLVVILIFVTTMRRRIILHPPHIGRRTIPPRRIHIKVGRQLGPQLSQNLLPLERTPIAVMIQILHHARAD